MNVGLHKAEYEGTNAEAQRAAKPSAGAMGWAARSSTACEWTDESSPLLQETRIEPHILVIRIVNEKPIAWRQV